MKNVFSKFEFVFKTMQAVFFSKNNTPSGQPTPGGALSPAGLVLVKPLLKRQSLVLADNGVANPFGEDMNHRVSDPQMAWQSRVKGIVDPPGGWGGVQRIRDFKASSRPD